MRHKLTALIALAVLGLPIGANALETDELIALTAMPLSAMLSSSIQCIILGSVSAGFFGALLPPISV